MRSADRRKRLTGPSVAAPAGIALVTIGLLLIGCTDATDPDVVIGAGRSDRPASGDPADSGNGADGSEPGDGAGADDGVLVEPIGIAGAVPVDPEIAEAPATEPRPDDGPDRDDDRTEAPQTGLGPGESVLCATVEIGLDAASDGATATMRTQRAKLIDGAGSVVDAELRSLLGMVERRDRLDEAVLQAALARCETLGYRT